MTNPDLAAILRRFYALAAAGMLPAGALLLSAGYQRWAVGLCFGSLVAALNAGMLAWRITRMAASPAEQALRVMQQGMGIRFSLILLASVVVVKVDPAAVPAFLLGLGVTMALATAVAARRLLSSAAAGRGAAASQASSQLSHGSWAAWRPSSVLVGRRRGPGLPLAASRAAPPDAFES